jgi:hypothetical protein
MSFLITDLKKLVSEYLSNPVINILSPTKEEHVDNYIVIEKNTGKNYFYLDKEDLTMQFGFDRDLTKTYLVYVCLYQINKTLEKPFVEYYMEERSGSYEFIQKTINASLLSEGEEPDVEENFIRQCEEVINSTFDKLSIDYKGFVEIDDKIYVFYENIGDDLIQAKLGSSLCIIDEIVNKKKIINIPVHESATKVFDENQELLKMKDDEGNLIENPIVAYLCKKNGNDYENITIDNTIDDLDIKINIEHFGNNYLFSTEPLNIVGGFFSFFSGSKKPKRFSLFLDNSKNIDNKDKSLLLYITENAGTIEEYNEYSCISYYENETLFWIVRSELLFTEI